MDDIDRVAARVSMAVILGALGGTGTALLLGRPMARTVGLTAFSCAMAGTACFGSERIATVLTRQVIGSQEIDSNRWEDVLATHAVGGFVGGSILGALYIKRPLRGAVFFVPLMLLIGTGEKLFEDLRRERIQAAIVKTPRQEV